MVVGGGAAGLCAAYRLRKEGKSVILLETEFVGSGASEKSSGFYHPGLRARTFVATGTIRTQKSKAANSTKRFAKVKREYDARTTLGYKGWLYDDKTIQTVIGSGG